MNTIKLTIKAIKTIKITCFKKYYTLKAQKYTFV